MDLFDFTLLDLLPESITSDTRIQAAAELVEAELKAVSGAIGNVAIWSRLDELTEPVLSTLAWALHVDDIEGWDLVETDAQKRAILRESLVLHRYKGTIWSIERVLGLLGLSATIREWFEYGGDPYKFMLEVGVSDREITADLLQRLMALVNEYKNVRSWLDEILVHYEVSLSQPLSAGCVGQLEAMAEMNNLLVLDSQAGADMGLGCMAGVDAVAIMGGV